MDDLAEACLSGHDYGHASPTIDGQDSEELDRVDRNSRHTTTPRLLSHDGRLSRGAVPQGCGCDRSLGFIGLQSEQVGFRRQRIAASDQRR